MFRSLGQTLFVALLAFSLILSLGLGGMFAWHLNTSFRAYLAQAELGRLGRVVGYLELRYAQHGSWQFVRHVDDLFPPRPPPPPSQMAQMELMAQEPGSDAVNLAAHGAPRPADAQGLAARIALLDAHKQWIIGTPAARGQPLRPLWSAEHTVIGYLALAPPLRDGPAPATNLPTPPADARSPSSPEVLADVFLRDQFQGLLFLTLAAILLAAGVSYALARRVKQRVQAVSDAVHTIANGSFTLGAEHSLTRVTQPSRLGSDELTQLAKDTQRMARILSDAEKARKDWVAQTSHELRTPLAIMRLHLDGLQEGVIANQAQNYVPIHQALSHLETLVADLQTLSETDHALGSGRYTLSLQPLNIVDFVQSLCTEYTPVLAAHGLAFSLHCAQLDRQQTMLADSERLRQVFANLLANSLQYCETPAADASKLLDPAQPQVLPPVQLRVHVRDGQVEMAWHDSPPSVPEEALGRIFARFYRGPSAALSHRSGCGLGLSIVQGIALAHHGTVHALPSDLGGLCVLLTFPCHNAKP